MQELDFFALNRSAGNESWCDTFAYWVLTLQNPENPFAREATEACAVMSFQYDVEDQAQDKEMLIGDHNLTPAVFTPIAPVTLALRWSPFPAAIATLGQPTHIDINKGNALAIFAPSAKARGLGLTSDQKHFDFLLEHARNRAIQTNALVLLVGSPGWAYNSEDFLQGGPEIRKLMNDFGFVYTLRKPTEE